MSLEMGTTPLPLPDQQAVDIWLDADAVVGSSSCQQPQSQQIAVFEATPNDDCLNGSVLDVNQAFVVYAVKNGLIRILHRHSTVRSLLRGHQGQRITDIRFFDQGDVLGTCGHSAAESTAFVWRIFERGQPEIASEKLLEIGSDSQNVIRRIVWHLFNPNQFFLLHSAASHGGTKVATLVETTRIATRVHPTEGHAVCDFGDVMQADAVQLVLENSDLEDLAWSGKDNRHVLSAHKGGQVVLWDVKTLSATSGRSTLTPAKLCQVQSEAPLSRCLFLPHPATATKTGASWTNCFVTAAEENSVVTLWSPFLEGGDEPTPLQTIHLESATRSSYILTSCHGTAPPSDGSPPACFLVLADRTAGKLLCLHVASAWRLDSPQGPPVSVLAGCNYVVPFRTKFPTYSWSVLCTNTIPTSDDDDDDEQARGSVNFDTTLYCYQSTVVQSLTLTASMCVPPSAPYTQATPNVRAQVVEKPAMQFDAYDVDDDDDDDEDDDLEDYQAPEASSLPPPNGFSPAVGSVPAPASMMNNPFSNWLGAIAAKTTEEAAPPPPPVSTPLPPTSSSSSSLPLDPAIILPDTIPSVDPPPPPNPPSSFLSPADFAAPPTAVLGVAPPPAAAPPKQQGRSRSTTPTKKHARKKSPKARAAAAPAKIAILKREEGPPPPKVSPKAELLDDADHIRRAVREEIQATVLPSMKKAIQEAVNESLMGPIQSSIRQLGQKGVTVDNDKLATALANSVQDPLQAAFASTVKKVLIPTLESVTGQVFVQVSDKLEQGLSAGTDSKEQMDALTLQVSTLAGLVTDLVGQVKELRSQLATDGPPKLAAAPVQPAVEVNALETTRTQVLGLLQAGDYEKAFTTAVSAATIDMTVFCCRHADLTAVLGGSTPALSQPILLCLMQQLGTILPGSDNDLSPSSDLTLELEWLQEIALSLDPADPSIHRHTPGVLQHLVASISKRMERGEPALRRPLQRLLQVVRGMQMG